MNSSYHSYTKTLLSTNLVGQTEHRQFIRIQAAYGIAQRGGVTLPFVEAQHHKRLVSDINILSSKENRQLIFSEVVFSN